MLSRRNIALLLTGAVVFVVSSVCGFGAPASNAPLPTPDFNEPSGGGAGGAPTAAAVATMPPPPTFSPDLPTAEPELNVLPAAIPESRRVTLEYPPQIRTGDSDVVRLTLEVDTLGNVTPTAETQGNKITGKIVKVPNLYETHKVIAESRLDLAGMEVRPSEEVSEPLLPGQSVTFFWSIRPPGSGTFRGTAWLFLRFVDKKTKEVSRIPISAQTVDISTMNLLGMSGGLARLAGGIGSVVGAIMGLPFAGDILKWLWRRIRRRQ